MFSENAGECWWNHTEFTHLKGKTVIKKKNLRKHSLSERRHTPSLVFGKTA